MMAINSSKHIINKVFLEVNTNSKAKGYYLKDNIDAFLQKEIVPILETCFDSLAIKNPSQSIQLEKLNLDIALNPNLDFEDFKQEIIKNIAKQIEEAFESKEKKSVNYKLVSAKEKEVARFFHFLETGTTTWWTTSNADFSPNNKDTFDKIINDSTFAVQWVKSIQKPIVRDRFIKQFNNDQIVTIIKKGFFKTSVAEDKTTIVQIENIKKTLETKVLNSQLTLAHRFLIWEIVVLSLLKKNTTVIKQRLSQLIYSIVESGKNSNCLEYKKQIVMVIDNQIESQNELKLLSNLTDFVLGVQKTIDTTILKEIERKNKLRNTDKTITDSYFIDSKSNPSFVPNNYNSVTSTSNNSNEIEPNDNENLVNKLKEVNKEIIDKKDPFFDKKKKTNEKLFSENKEENVNNEASDVLLNHEVIDESGTDFYAENIGLIVLHPFLKSLFDNCKLLNKDNTINNPEVAAHLLHYAATGREQAYEHQMTFEKFLCDIPIAEPIERNIVLSDDMKKEVSEMLQAVLKNWDVMKKSSVELLQNEFLQRSGKLIVNDGENPKIVVEKKTQDILLDKLSWNLSIIKLAWKKRIIYVDW